MPVEKDIKYSFLKYRKFSLNRYSIEPLRFEDIFEIGKWRNEQISILRQKLPLTHNDQKRFFVEVVEKTFKEPKPEQMLFSYFLDDTCIGYGGLVHIDWDQKIAEISFINKTERSSKRIKYYADLTNFLYLMLHLGFNVAEIENVTTETYSIRENTLSVLNELGFTYKNKNKSSVTIEGKNYDSIFHEYNKKNFNVNKEIKEIK